MKAIAERSFDAHRIRQPVYQKIMPYKLEFLGKVRERGKTPTILTVPIHHRPSLHRMFTSKVCRYNECQKLFRHRKPEKNKIDKKMLTLCDLLSNGFWGGNQSHTAVKNLPPECPSVQASDSLRQCPGGYCYVGRTKFEFLGNSRELRRLHLQLRWMLFQMSWLCCSAPRSPGCWASLVSNHDEAKYLIAFHPQCSWRMYEAPSHS